MNILLFLGEPDQLHGEDSLLTLPTSQLSTHQTSGTSKRHSGKNSLPISHPITSVSGVCCLFVKLQMACSAYRYLIALFFYFSASLTSATDVVAPHEMGWHVVSLIGATDIVAPHGIGWHAVSLIGATDIVVPHDID